MEYTNQNSFPHTTNIDVENYNYSAMTDLQFQPLTNLFHSEVVPENVKGFVIKLIYDTNG